MPGELPFIGRTDELAALHSWLGEAIASGPRAVLVRGEAGVGKTRLLDRFTADVVRANPGVVVLRATCYQDAPVPYLPLATALRPIGDLASLLPLIDDTRDRADERRLQLYVGAADLVERAAAARPLLVVIDDLHWADQGTVQLLAHLLHVVKPMMAVLPHRPVATGPLVEFTERVRRAEWHREIDMFGLDRFALHDLVEGLTGERPSRKLLDGLADASGGNPLLVRALLSRLEAFGVLTLRDGLLTHRGGEEILAGPAELDDMLRHRVRELSRPCIDLLVTAAFLGEGARVQDLRVLAGLSEERFATVLHEATASGVLHEEDVIRFDHPQLRYVLYQRPRGAKRRELHLKVADHLASLQNDESPRVVELAHHLRRAGDAADPDRVMNACIAAASRAAAVVAWGEAALAYDGAIEAAERSGSESPGLVALLHARSAYAHWYNHDNRRAADHARDAIEIARALGDRDVWADALTTLARALWSGDTGMWGGVFDLSLFDEFIAHSGDREDVQSASVFTVRGTLRFMATDVDGGRDDLDTAVTLAERGDNPRVLSEALFAQASVYLGELEVQSALHNYKRAREIDSAGGHDLRLVSGHRAAATLRWLTGDLEEAAREARLALEGGPAIAAWAEMSSAAAVATGIAVAQGRLDEAEDLGAAAEQMMRWAGYPPSAQWLYPALACARSMRGDFAGAHEALDAWSLLGTPGVNRYRALVHTLEGRVDAVRPFAARGPLLRPHSFDLPSLGCAVEIGDSLDDLDRIAWAAPGITYAAERGARFELGWCFFIPRLAGVAALRLGQLDVAARWLDLAASEAERSHASLEVQRVERDRDRLRAVTARR